MKTTVNEWPFWLDDHAHRAAAPAVLAERLAADYPVRAAELEGVARGERLSLEERVLEELAFEGRPLTDAPRVTGRIMQAAYAKVRGGQR